VRIDGTKVETIPIPNDLNAVGMHWLDSKRCLVLLAKGWSPAKVAIFSGASFKTIASPKLESWVGRLRCRAWRNAIYVPTTKGVYAFDGKRFEKTSDFKAVSLWPVGDALVCRGYRDGSPAHEILRDGKWEDFHVPEPGVVSGGHGKVVWLGPREKVPVAKVRIVRAPAPPAPRRPASPSEMALPDVYIEPVLIVAAFSGTTPIGRDGGGQIFYAAESARAPVFIYGPGVGELKLLADSRKSFERLNALMDRWSDITRKNGWEDDDLMDGSIDKKHPDFVWMRKLALALKGKVHLPGFDATDLASDFDEMVTEIAGKKLTLPATIGATELALHRRAHWLRALFERETFFEKEARALDRRRKDPYAKHAASRLYWLWHHFFLDNEKELEVALRAAARDRSPIIRETAAVILRDARYVKLRKIVRGG
jgi:hypothetical protein